MFLLLCILKKTNIILKRFVVKINFNYSLVKNHDFKKNAQHVRYTQTMDGDSLRRIKHGR